MGSVSLSRTKVVVPSLRPEILSRERLLNLLTDLLDKKLILLSAPAGYGKTTLLIDLAHHSDIKLCWLSLDALDQEPQRFISYFLAAISQRFPQFGKRSLASLNNLTSLDQGFENLLVTMVNEIFERINEHFVIVLDDYQFVDDIEPIRGFINRFVQLAGENCHLLLSSRTVPALPDMLSMIARDQVGGLSLLELAFQEEEIRRLFEKNYGMRLGEKAAVKLVEQTEGWITGLYLSKWAEEVPLPEGKRARRTINLNLYEYLSQQVLERQSPEMRGFLLQTSLLEEFNEEACTAILKRTKKTRQSWRQLLRAVQQNNLFVLPVGPQGKWLRYHHLFQDFLQQVMREENPALAEAILQRAAEYHGQQGEWEKAYHIHKQRSDSEAIIQLVEKSGSQLIQNDRLLTLGNWLNAIPEEAFATHPVLLSLKGFLSLVRGNPESGLPLLTQAEALFRSREDQPNLAFTLVRRAWAQRLLGDYKGSIATAEEVFHITRGRASLQSLRGEALRSKGLCLFRLGQAKQAIEWLAKALASFEKEEKRRHAAMVQTELGMAYRATGEYKLAEEYYEGALKTLQKSGDLTWQATLQNSMGVLHHTQGNCEKALRAFEDGLQCAKQSGYLATEALILTSLGDLHTETGDLELAQQTYDQAGVIAQQAGDQFLLNYLALAEAELARLHHADDRALSLLEETLPAIKASDSHYEQGLYYYQSGRVYLTSGNTQQAIWDLQEAIEHFRQGGLVMENAWALLWFAAACKAFGDQDSACLHIKEGLGLIEASQPVHSLEVTLLQVKSWIEDLSDREEAGPAFPRLLSQARRLEGQLPRTRMRLRRLSSAVPTPPPKLTIHALGKAQVRINGKLISNSQWQTQSVRELFFYFFINGKPVSKEKVGAAFWPDISPAQLKLRFKNNIYRLRRAVGQDTVLFDENLYRFNPNLDHAYDVDDFRAELVLAEDAEDPNERIQHLEAAVGLVHGDFLEDISSDWAWHERDRIEQQYLSALLRLSRLLLQGGRKEEALDYCQRALTRDDCLEEGHQLAMQIYAARKERAAVIRQYKRCQDNLRKGLGALISPETEEVYRQLMH